MVKVQSGSLNKSPATLVDPTGSITAVFWQEWADCVDIDKTYIFKNLRVKKKPIFPAKSMPIVKEVLSYSYDYKLHLQLIVTITVIVEVEIDIIHCPNYKIGYSYTCKSH